MSNHTKKKPAYFPVSPNLAVPVRNGFLVATPASDPLYPGIDVEFIPDEQHADEYKEVLSKPRVLIEEPQDDTRLRALLWTDPQKEDYTKEITLAEYETPYCPHYKERCADCAVLIETDGKWYCDELDKPCEEIVHCPEGVFTPTPMYCELGQVLSHTSAVCDYCKKQGTNFDCNTCPIKRLTKQALNNVYGSQTFSTNEDDNSINE